MTVAEHIDSKERKCEVRVGRIVVGGIRKIKLCEKRGVEVWARRAKKKGIIRRIILCSGHLELAQREYITVKGKSYEVD